MGVRLAHAIASGQSGGFRSGRAYSPRPSAPTLTECRARTGAGQISVEHDAVRSRAPSRSWCGRKTRPATSGTPPAVTARIDNTPPARVDVAVEGGDGWRNSNEFGVAWANPPEADRAPIAAAGYELCPAAPGAARAATSGARPSHASSSKCPRRANGPCRSGAATPRATRPRTQPPFRSRCVTTPSHRSSASSRRRHRSDVRRGGRHRQGLGARGRQHRDQRQRLGRLAGTSHAEGRQPAGDPHRRRQTARRRLRAPRAGDGPGRKRGLDRQPRRRPADGGHAAAQNRRRACAPASSGCERSGGWSAGTASALGSPPR